MEFPITAATVAGILLILQQCLMLSAGMYRAKVKVGVGLTDDPNLERVVRRHGNLAENAGIFIVTLALLELLVGSTNTVFWLGVAFVVGRLAHAIGFMSLAGSHMGEGSKLFLVLRSGGAFCTAFSGIAAGGILIYSLLG